MEGFDVSRFLMFVVAIVLGITVHEFAHAWTADRLGDELPRSQGRVTLSPLAHLDPLGSLFMLVSYFAGMGIGWGRPVQTNPNNYRGIDRRLGHSLVTVAGPVSNLILALLFALVLRAGVIPVDDAYDVLVVRIVWINLLLFFFNLIPLYPLDGSHLLANALPRRLSDGYYRFVARWGILLFLLLAMTGLLGELIAPPALRLFALFTGRYPFGP
jgi:Zn-dependent protease